MKTHDFIYLLLIWLSTVLLSCEKSTDQSVTFKGTLDEFIQYREVGSCDQCPDDDCCCGIELINPFPSKQLRLCGTSDGLASCSSSPPSPCSSISGGGQSKTLTTIDPKLLFCMVKGNSLSVTNTHATIAAIISITCQYDEVGAQTVLDTIPALMTHSYLVSNTCGVNECP